MLQAASPTLQTAYAYSGDGRRISSAVNGTIVQYIYDGLVPVAERDASGATIAAYTKIPQAPGGIGGLISRTDGTNTIYYHCSHLGNVNLITDSSGNVIQTYDYDAFGNVVAESGSLENEYKYKSKETSEETGLVYFGARYYNPLLGRFITPDPLGMVDGANVYMYCGNDPVNLMDEWGLMGFDYDKFTKEVEKWRFDNIYVTTANLINLGGGIFRYPRAGIGTASSSPTSFLSKLGSKVKIPLPVQIFGTKNALRLAGRFSAGLLIAEGFWDLGILIEAAIYAIDFDDTNGCN